MEEITPEEFRQQELEDNYLRDSTKPTLHLPIFKADRLDGKGEVEGYLVESHIFLNIGNTIGLIRSDLKFYQINPGTLKQKIGDEWYSISFIEACVKQTLRRDARSCSNCRYYEDYGSCEISHSNVEEHDYCTKWEYIDEN